MYVFNLYPAFVPKEAYGGGNHGCLVRVRGNFLWEKPPLPQWIFLIPAILLALNRVRDREGFQCKRVLPVAAHFPCPSPPLPLPLPNPIPPTTLLPPPTHWHQWPFCRPVSVTISHGDGGLIALAGETSLLPAYSNFCQRALCSSGGIAA